MSTLHQNVFVLVCVIPPTANFPNSILTNWIASWRMKASKRTGITDYTQLKSFGIHLKSSMTRVLWK